MSSTASAQTPDALSSTLLTGRSLVLLQLLSRLLTFGLNQSLIRIASPEVFGTAAIQFDLVCSTILFLSREGIRNASLRSKQDVRPKVGNGRRQDEALSIIPLQLGMIVAALVCSIYLYSSLKATTSQPNFHLSLGSYVLSALLELAIEPLYLRALRSTPPRINIRVQAEGGMAIGKAVVTVASLLVLPGKPLLGFALGQLAGAVWLAGRYLFEFGDIKGLLWVSTPQGYVTVCDHQASSGLAHKFRQNRFDPGTLSLAIANTRQSVIKHVLTEADRIAVGRISPLGDQGGYAVAMNYGAYTLLPLYSADLVSGSLVARIVFQPLEETLLLHFSTSLSAPSTPHLLIFVLHISAHLLLLLPAFLPPLLLAILPILFPRRYIHTSAPSTLETYLKWYIPLLSLNGILEAFHASSSTPGQVARQARWMIGSSAAFALGLFGLIHLPKAVQLGTEKALIYASCLAMLFRIAYAWQHASRFFAGRTGGLSVSSVAPRLQAIVSTLVSGCILRILEQTGRWRVSWRGWMELVGAGGVLGLGVLAIM